MQADPFTTPRLLLRAIEDEDEPFLRAIDADHVARMNAYQGQPKPASKAGAKETRKWLEGSLLGVLICLREEDNAGPASATGDSNVAATEASQEGGSVDVSSSAEPKPPPPIGWIVLAGPRRDEAHHRETSISIGILGPYRSKGYGREAIEWALDYAFGLMGLHRVCIGCLGWNEGARRLYSSMGFVLEAKLREAAWFKGKWWDIYDFSMLEREWRQRRQFAEDGVMLVGS